MILFYGSKIVGGIAGLILCAPGKDRMPGNAATWFFGSINNNWVRFGCVLALLLLVNLIWKGYVHAKGVLAKALKGLHSVFIVIASLAALGYSLANVVPSPVLLKDGLGYGMGLIVAILIWKLHTVVQRGIVQLWRYTKGVDTEARKQ